MTNNKFYLLGSIKSALKFSGSLLILALFSQYVLADVKINNQYALPSNKLQMELCEREALLLHSGEVEQEQVLHQQGGFEVRYDIQTNDGSKWSVLCNLATGKIIGEQKQLGENK